MNLKTSLLQKNLQTKEIKCSQSLDLLKESLIKQHWRKSWIKISFQNTFQSKLEEKTIELLKRDNLSTVHSSQDNTQSKRKLQLLQSENTYIRMRILISSKRISSLSTWASIWGNLSSQWTLTTAMIITQSKILIEAISETHIQVKEDA